MASESVNVRHRDAVEKGKGAVVSVSELMTRLKQYRQDKVLDIQF